MTQIQVTNTSKEPFIIAASVVNINMLSSLQGKVSFIDKRRGGGRTKGIWLHLHQPYLYLPFFILFFFSRMYSKSKLSFFFGWRLHWQLFSQVGLPITERKLIWAQLIFCGVCYYGCDYWRSWFLVCSDTWCSSDLLRCFLGQHRLLKVIFSWFRISISVAEACLV